MWDNIKNIFFNFHIPLTVSFTSRIQMKKLNFLLGLERQAPLHCKLQQERQRGPGFHGLIPLRLQLAVENEHFSYILYDRGMLITYKIKHSKVEMLWQILSLFELVSSDPPNILTKYTLFHKRYQTVFHSTEFCTNLSLSHSLLWEIKIQPQILPLFLYSFKLFLYIQFN